MDFGLLLKALTDHEFDTGKDQYAKAISSEEDQLFGSSANKRIQPFADSQATFNNFATEYTAAVRAYIDSKPAIEAEKQKQQQIASDGAVSEQKMASGRVVSEEQMKTEQQKLADAKKRLDDQVAEQKATNERDSAVEELRRQTEITVAKSASLDEEHAIRQRAAASALKKQHDSREQKLAACLSSPEYKIWETALQVEQGNQMMADAQKVLDHENAVENESGVVDLVARRKAGEQKLAGQDLTNAAFDEYKKLGGKASKPADVVAGPDPAAEFR